MQRLCPEKDALRFFVFFLLSFFFSSCFVFNWKSTVLGYSFVWISQQPSSPRVGEKRRMEGVEHPALIGY